MEKNNTFWLKQNIWAAIAKKKIHDARHKKKQQHKINKNK